MANSDDSNSCLGLVNLSISSWLIALLQLSYNVFSLMTDLDSLHSNLDVFLHLSLALADILGLVAAFILCVGNLILGRKLPEYLLVWLGLTSLQPLLTLAQILQQAANLEPRLVAEVMTRDGVQVILTIYCMYLMLTHYREIKQRNSQDLVIKAKLRSYNTI